MFPLVGTFGKGGTISVSTRPELKLMTDLKLLPFKYGGQKFKALHCDEWM